MIYFCIQQARVLDKPAMDTESCLDVSMQHDGAPRGPCKMLVQIEEDVPVEEQCDSMRYNNGDNVKCIRRRIHDGPHVARKVDGFVIWEATRRFS